jgi:polyferredoxin
VVVLPSTTAAHSLHTPAGRKVVVCPATYRNDVKCFNCGICYSAVSDRAVIGFPAHGTKKRVIDIQLSRGSA